jgi:hypothetical protein
MTRVTSRRHHFREAPARPDALYGVRLGVLAWERHDHALTDRSRAVPIPPPPCRGCVPAGIDIQPRWGRPDGPTCHIYRVTYRPRMAAERSSGSVLTDATCFFFSMTSPGSVGLLSTFRSRRLVATKMMHKVERPCRSRRRRWRWAGSAAQAGIADHRSGSPRGRSSSASKTGCAALRLEDVVSYNHARRAGGPSSVPGSARYRPHRSSRLRMSQSVSETIGCRG